VRTRVQLVRFDTKEFVDAEVFDEITIEHFLEAQKKWRPVVLEAAKKLFRSGMDELMPRHFHWDWTTKEADLRVLAFNFVGIRCQGELQGLMKLSLVGHVSRHPAEKGKPLVYVDYLETAPWNIKSLMKALGKTPQFAAVGSRLIQAAAQKSVEEGFKGRIGLHSLSASERFYQETCGMTALERDIAKEHLMWYEFTPQQARFLDEGAL
jgi:hypothetical protein